mgnify:CR=1 FL=1
MIRDETALNLDVHHVLIGRNELVADLNHFLERDVGLLQRFIGGGAVAADAIGELQEAVVAFHRDHDIGTHEDEAAFVTNGGGETIDAATHEQILAAIHAGYTEQADIRHGAARGWIDRIIEPHKTRDELIAALAAANQGWDYSRPFKTGVLQT